MCKLMYTRLSFLTALFVFFFPAWAEKPEPKQIPWYQIEIILFEHTGTHGFTSEKWPEIAELPDLNNLTELLDPDDPAADINLYSRSYSQFNNDAQETDIHPVNLDNDTGPVPYVLIKDKKKLKLLSTYKKIQRSSSKNEILYLTWRQPTVDRDKATPVHIHGGTQFPNDITPVVQTNTNDLDTYQEYPSENSFSDNIVVPLNETTESLLGPPPPAFIEQIDGSIMVSVSRYLHVWTNLVYSNPIKQEFTSEPDSKEYRLIRFPMKQHRRMRSKKIHYIDHPLFGMLVLITPYKLPKPEVPSDITGQPES